MLPKKLPKPSEWCPENDPQTEEEWEGYFECRKKCDIDFSAEERSKLRNTVLGLDFRDPKFFELGNKMPEDPKMAMAVKRLRGLNAVMHLNLCDAKEAYPEEF